MSGTRHSFIRYGLSIDGMTDYDSGIYPTNEIIPYSCTWSLTFLSNKLTTTLHTQHMHAAAGIDNIMCDCCTRLFLILSVLVAIAVDFADFITDFITVAAYFQVIII